MGISHWDFLLSAFLKKNIPCLFGNRVYMNVKISILMHTLFTIVCNEPYCNMLNHSEFYLLAVEQQSKVTIVGPSPETFIDSNIIDIETLPLIVETQVLIDINV